MPTPPRATALDLVVLWDGTAARPWGPYLADALRAPAPPSSDATPAQAGRPTRGPSTEARTTWDALQGILAAAAAPMTAHQLAAASGVAPAVVHAALTYRVRAGHVAATEADRTAAAGFLRVRAFTLTERGRGAR